MLSLDAKVIAAIYEAALSDEKWSEALDYCADALDADSALLYEHPIDRHVSFSTNEASSKFKARLANLAKYNQMVAEGKGSGYDDEGLGYVHTLQPFETGVDTDIWTIDKAYIKRPEIELGMAEGFLRRSFVNLSDDPIRMRGAVFMYGREHVRQIPDLVHTLGRQFAPHLFKSMELFRFTNDLRAKYNAVLSVLDRVKTGILVVTEDGKIVVANAAAKQVMEARPGLIATRSGRISCSEEDATNDLLHAIRHASGTARGEDNAGGRAVRIPRDVKGAPVVAIVSPLRDARMEIEKGLTGALITVIDPLEPISVQLRVLRLAYKLSDRETQVADLVLSGLTNTEIAEELGVSPETIKSQISSVFQKSGCRNRLDFIWRVFQLAPPID